MLKYQYYPGDGFNMSNFAYNFPNMRVGKFLLKKSGSMKNRVGNQTLVFRIESKSY